MMIVDFLVRPEACEAWIWLIQSASSQGAWPDVFVKNHNWVGPLALIVGEA